MSSCLDLDDLEFGFNKHAPKIEKKAGNIQLHIGSPWTTN